MEEFTPGDNFPAYISVVPKGDINKDEYVDFNDVNDLGSEWLSYDCNEPNDFCYGADINKDTFVDFRDWAVLANDWLKCVDAANPACDKYWVE